MKVRSMRRWLAVAACVGVTVAIARAGTINLSVDPNLPPGSTPYVVGAMNPGSPASDAADIIYINTMIGLSLGGSTTVKLGGVTDTIYRSQNTFASLPTASAAGALDGTSTSIVLSSGYTYLVAKYDGLNGGAEVWYVGDFAAGTTLIIPQAAFGTANSKYGLSGTVLLGPTGSVPDGGLTLAMLGTALAGLSLVRWKVR